MRNIKSTPFFAALTNILVLFLIYTICRISFYLINIGFFPNTSASSLVTMCLAGLRFDLTALLYINALYLVLVFLPLKLRNTKPYKTVTKVIFILFNSIGIAANCYDMIYFQFINRRTTFDFFTEFQNDNNLLTIALQGMIGYWYVTLLFIVLFIVLYFAYRPLPDVTKPEKPYLYYPAHFIDMCIVVLLTVLGIRGGTFSVTVRPININIATTYVNEPIEAAIVLNTPFTIMMSADGADYSNAHYFDDREELQSYCNPFHYPTPNGEPKYDNVVLIFVESLAREYVGYFYHDFDGGTYKGYTPFLDSLLAQSLTFKHSFATGKLSIDVLPSAISGIPALYAPFVTTQFATNEIGSLAKCLKERGYQSAYFHGGTNGSLGLNAYTNMAGVDKYYGRTEYNNDADFDGTWAIWDEEFLQYTVNELDTFKTPFLGIVFTATSHHPFALPEKYKGVFPKGPDDMYETIGYADYSLRRFFEAASKKDWYKNTLFVLTADHTTTITRPEFLNGRGFYDIPILFFHPSDPTLTGVSDRVFGQTDITPSILGYLNYDKPYFAFGKDIFNKADTTNFVIDYYSPIFQIFQDSLLLQFDGEKKLGVYNYFNDLGLKDNIMGTYPAQEQEMENRLKAEIQTFVECMFKDSLCVKTQQ